MEKAKAFASKPETKEKIEQAREKLTGKHQPAAEEAKATPAGTPGAEPKSPGTPPAGGTPPVNAPDPEPVGQQPAQGNPPVAS
jgi:hypothetical protein